MFLCQKWCCFASVFLAILFLFLFVFVCFLLLFFCVFLFVFLLHTREKQDSVIFLVFDDTFFVHTIELLIFAREYLRAQYAICGVWDRGRLTRCGTICARILEQKKKIFEFLSNNTLNVLFIVWRWDVHMCEWWSWGSSVPKIFFNGFSSLFVCFSSFFLFLVLLFFFFFFFFIPKETKSACVSTTTHQRTHKRKNNTNERKSIDQIIIKNQKCKARDTRTCSSANARAGKTWGNRTWPQFKRWRTSWRAV